TYLTTARAPIWTHFSRRESWKIVVQDKLVVSIDKCTIDHLLIVFGTQSNRSQRLGFPTGKDRRTMCCRKIIHFRPDRAYRTHITTIQTDTFVQYEVTNSLILYIMVIFLQ